MPQARLDPGSAVCQADMLTITPLAPHMVNSTPPFIPETDYLG